MAEKLEARCHADVTRRQSLTGDRLRGVTNATLEDVRPALRVTTGADAAQPRTQRDHACTERVLARSSGEHW